MKYKLQVGNSATELRDILFAGGLAMFKTKKEAMKLKKLCGHLKGKNERLFISKI